MESKGTADELSIICILSLGAIRGSEGVLNINLCFGKMYILGEKKIENCNAGT